MKWAGPFGDRPFFYSPFLFKFVSVLNRIKMKKTIVTLLGLLMAVTVSQPVFAAEPDAPGSKMFTIQAGYGPGIGGLVSGNIAIAQLGSAHLYGGLQAGAYFRHGNDAKRTDLSIAPRFFLGFPISRVFEVHFGALAGVASQHYPDLESKLMPSFSGFGGLRFSLSDSLYLIAEGYYFYPQKYLHTPYGTAGLAFRF